MSSGLAPYSKDLQATADANGAAVNGVVEVGQSPVTGTVTAVTYTPAGAIAGAATNSRTLSVVNRGQLGAGSTVVATLALVAGVDGTQGAALAIPLQAGVAVATGDSLEFQSTAVGTGIADPGGAVKVTVARS